MASPATVPMISKDDGQVYDLPQENMQAALADGHKLAIPMTSPDGEKHFVPHDRVLEAQNEGKWSVDHTAAETPSLTDTLKKSFSLGNIAKNVGAGVSELAQGAIGAVTHPNDTIDATIQAGKDEHGKAIDELNKGSKSAAFGHELASYIPLIGPWAASLAEQAGKGDIGGAVAKGGTQVLAGEAVKAGVKGATDLAKTAGKPVLLQSAEELASATPKRIAELKTVPDKLAAVQKLAVDTEAKAKAAAKAAYPDINTPITRTAVDANGKVAQQSVSFDKVQQERSLVGQEISNEQRNVARGAPAYDLKALAKKYGELSDELRAAAQADGKLKEFQSAEAKWKQFMDDFHNKNAAVRPLLDITPDQTGKISDHLLSRDKGARTMQVLRKYGADTRGAETLLSRGSTPLKVDVTESSKLTKAGSDAGYRTQRLNEALDQATTNRLPSGSEAKLPAKAMSGKVPLFLDQVPGGKALSPRSVTRVKLSRALSKP